MNAAPETRRTARRTLDDLRSQFAYEEVRGWDKRWCSEAVSLAKELPVALRRQGLIVVLAWLLRGEEAANESTALARLLSDWLLTKHPWRPVAPSGARPTPQSLLDACVKADRAGYRAAQGEALAILEKTKLFAQALYPTGGGEATDGR